MVEINPQPYQRLLCDRMYPVLSQDETPLLYSLVCGEGVVNDAMSIVLFKIVQDFDLVHIDTGVAFQVVGNFIHLFLTSTILGVIVGLLSAYIIKKNCILGGSPHMYTYMLGQRKKALARLKRE
ncbi:Sodium/hydrogen exchanger 2 [Acorus calamus]|uniref:Sodium/hydrogen exchanger 2 n=1 Tax=Acorus calamus TaxID=4465 RepID=A0AAV9FS87_ACOCL|nr:Sodium/hydrogen exchanger 2 [Acorus calamus]